MTTKKLLRGMAMMLAVAITATGAMIWSKHVYAAPAAFTVTNINDSGPGSLRQAIEDANTNSNPSDQDTITFNIAATGDQVVWLESPLSITESVLIDGYTQGDAEENTNLSPLPMNGTIRITLINYDAGSGIAVTAPNVTIKGLNLQYAQGGNLLLDHADNFKLVGSYLDTGTDGYGRTKEPGSEKSVVITSSDSVTIGGTAAADRNVLGYCVSSCIEAGGTSGDPTNNLRIQGNYIGVGPDGVATLYAENLGVPEYGSGIRLNAGVTNPVIGGTASGAGNTLKSATFSAIYAEDVDNLTVQGNRILRNSNRSLACGSCNAQAAAIFLGGVTDSLIGSSNSTGKNVIAGNLHDAVVVGNSVATTDPSTNVTIQGNNFGVMDDGTIEDLNSGSNIKVMGNSDYINIRNNIIKHAHALWSSDQVDGIALFDNAQNVSILGNSIYDSDNMGIDINNNGPTTNDTNDSDGGPNGRLNYPTYYQITETGGNTKIDFRYLGAPGNYRIEFFSNNTADSPGPGEGETYLGTTNVTSDGSGDQSFTQTVSGTGHTNITLTATLIDNASPNGFGPTSEFGASGPAPNPPTDLVISKELLNPEAMTVGGLVQYEVTLTNDGPYPIDIGAWDGSMPSSNDLLTDILPPQLAYSSSIGSNISCTGYGPGSIGTYLPEYYPNHADYELVLCGYTGGSHILNDGDSVSVIVVAEVLDAKNIMATNYVVGPLATGDPDRTAVVAAFDAAINNGDDVIDTFLGAPNNNFAYAVPAGDIDISKKLTNPEDATVGGVLEYDITVTNNGADAVNLAAYDAADPTRVLFTDALPPELQYQGVAGGPVSCTSPGTMSIFGPAGADHPNHVIWLCGMTADYMLGAGDSVVITLSAEVLNAKNALSTNFIVQPGVSTDPDSSGITTAFTSGQDVFTYLLTHPNGNFSYARPSTDLVVSKRLLNSQDLALGADLQYEVTVTNGGSDAINLAFFEATGPSDYLFFDIMPPALTFNNVVSGPMNCNSLAPTTVGSLFGPAMANHSGYFPVICGFNGGDSILEAGQSITTVLSMEVTDDTDLDFTNYMIGATFPGEATYARMGQGFMSGQDLIDYFLGIPNNNFAYAASQTTDLDLTKVLDDPEAVADQADIHYTLTLTNNGPYAADITAFTGTTPVQDDLFLDILPDNLTLISSSNPNMPCVVRAPASAIPFFPNHPNYNVVSCYRSGGSTQLASGESISTTITAKVTGPIGEGFTNFALASGSGNLPGDPDNYRIRQGFTQAAINDEDVIDLLIANAGEDGIVQAVYTVPGGGNNNGGNNGGTNGGSGNSGIVGKLGETGERLFLPVIVPLAVLTSSLLAIRYFKRKSYRVQ